MIDNIDVVEPLPDIVVPTLVMHRRDDNAAPFEEGRLMASSIPGARFMAFEGGNHIPLRNEAMWPGFWSEVRAYAAGELGYY